MRTLILLSLAALLTLPLPAHAQDRGKKLVETPTEVLLEDSAPTKKDERGGRAAPDNPRVAPGKVRWHPDAEAAHSAAQESGRPVLVFQLLGRLDQEFC